MDDNMHVGHLLANLRKDHPNAVAREDDEGVYFDLSGNDHPEDPILDVASTLYIKDGE
jgi:hypothetical protein